MKFTTVASDAFQKLQLNAGVLLTEFDPSVGSIDRSKIFAATSGGVQFTVSPEFIDFGDDIDNVPANTKELKVLQSVTATMTGTLKTVDTAVSKKLMAAADYGSNGKITPRADLKQGDFFHLWWVGDYSNANTGASAGFIAIKLVNALSTGGFSLQSNDKNKGDFSFEFTGHYSLEDITVLPYEIYIQSGVDSTSDASLSDLEVGSLTLTPTFDANVTEYAATTSNSSETVDIAATDSDAAVAITVNGNSIADGGSASLVVGTNTIVITVTNDDAVKTYRVIVTRTAS